MMRQQGAQAGDRRVLTNQRNLEQDSELSLRRPQLDAPACRGLRRGSRCNIAIYSPPGELLRGSRWVPGKLPISDPLQIRWL